MKMPIALLAAAAPLGLLAGCSGSGESENNVSSDTNVAASDTSASASPFADAERKMNGAMMSAVGSDAGQSWAKKMIAHHQGAIDMSQAVLAQNPTPDVATMARETIDKQKKDIADIQKLVKDGAPDQKAAEVYRPAMMDMKQKMDAVTGSDASQVYMRKMLEHHKGAVAMSDVALKNGVGGAFRAQVQKTREDNQNDSAMVEAVLAGKSMSEAMSSSGAKPAKSEPAPGAKAADMNAMGNMDMNRM